MGSATSAFSSMSISGENGVRRGRAARGERGASSQRRRMPRSISLADAEKKDNKIVYLAEMFPSVDRFTIEHTLRKCDQDIERSMDILLNLAFLHQLQPEEDDDEAVDVTIRKGIDGFERGSEDEVPRKQGRKKKKKGRGEKRGSSAARSEDESPHNFNRWDVGKRDVDFISARTIPRLKRETVASVYHANGASLAATVRSLAEANAPLDEHRWIDDEPVLAAHVVELTKEFSSIPPTTLAGLMRITSNSLSAAEELAMVLVSHDLPARPSLSDVVKIVAPPITALDDDDDEDDGNGTRGSGTLKDYAQARAELNSHAVSSASEFSKASAAYRRGRSDRLMSGAAAYYSAVGRDHLEKAKREASVAADVLVDAQSNPDMLDLHGVGTQDAVRIARSKVAEWWEAQGDAKHIPGGTHHGYQIVTGAGRHSRDGASRLGPAVAKMLEREKWKFEVQEGVLTVVGVARRH